jgi:ankyrin repeat protein
MEVDRGNGQLIEACAEFERVHEQLVYACTEEPQSIDKIRYLVESCPDAVKVRSRMRLLNKGDEFSIAQYPEIEGYPLHFVFCLNQTVPLQAVECLVEQFPDAIKTTDFSYRRLPLHFACSNKAALEVVQYLVKKWPASVRKPSGNGNLLPLHLACANQAALDVVWYLVQQCPQSLQATNIHGDLPLHQACASKAPLEVIRYLVQEYAESLQITNYHGYLPLNLACANQAALNVVRYLVQECHESLQVTDNDGNLPLHLACTNQAALGIVRYLVQECPESLKLTNTHGDLPLHLACASKAPLEVVRYLVQENPVSLQVTGNCGNLPLHLACANQASLEVVQYLVEQWPDAVKSTTDEGRLPLNLACWAETGSFDELRTVSLDVIQYLVEHWPDAVKRVSVDTSIGCIHQLNWQVYSYLRDRLNLIMAATEPTWTSLSALFRPKNDQHVRAVELLPGVTTDDILVTGITWEVFCYFLYVVKNVWITETTCVSLTNTGQFSSWFSIGHPESTRVRVGFRGNSPGRTIEFVLRLLTNSEQQVVRVEYSDRLNTEPLPISGPALSRFFEQSTAQRVELACVTLDEDQCRALRTVSQSDMEIQLQDCSLSDDTGCRDAFIECLQSDGGPTELDRCQIDCQILADALVGNSRVVKANIRLDTGMAALFHALAVNRGLEELLLEDHYINNENWLKMCEALQEHPTLTSLYYGYISSDPDALSAKQRKTRTRAIVEMLETNTVMCEIDQDDDDEWDMEIYEDLILPRLATNIFRHRLTAVEETTADPFRKRVLGRVLQSESVRSDSSRVWMLLSNNANIVLDAGKTCVVV